MKDRKWFRVAISLEDRTFGAEYCYSTSKENAAWTAVSRRSVPFGMMPQGVQFDAEEIDPNLVPYKTRAFTEATDEDLLAILKNRGVKLARFL
jgi:hypothetical protein